ncbi:MAG: hypothetical protein AM326_00050 [Candidatus Thorarchaeota archaeon SMTZ-45]|nr:MAG: hypothetical protein AM326_00050 [Candidatus Thorarchaeota archaeon SMTZ-45]
MVKIFSQSKEFIINAIKNGDVTIAVYGMGNIGLPIAAIFANSGAKVVGVEIDKERVKMINNGICYIENEPELNEMFQESYEKGRISATSDLLKGAKLSDVKIITVPTLLKSSMAPDLSAIQTVIEQIGKGLFKDDIIIIESSLPPGTTEGILKNALERYSGLKAGTDFGLAFSPERVMSGQVIKDFTLNYPKIVGGINEKSANAVVALYNSVIKNDVIKVSDAKTAEAVKVFKGVYRDVNIALANELALISEKLGLDIIEIIKVANTEPFSNIHIPGAGVGGHCIPYYPYFVMDVATNAGITPTLIRTAREINENMPNHVVDLTVDGLKEVGKSPQLARIAIFGLTFRGDAKEYKNTPASEIITKLRMMGANLIAWDPMLKRDEVLEFFKIDFASEPEDAFAEADCVIVVTDHSSFRQLKIANFTKKMKMPGVIVDARHVFNPLEVMRNGLVYRGIGRIPKVF